MKKNVLIGLSGGIDSAVAALLLKNEGYNVIGITFLMQNAESSNSKIHEQALIRESEYICSILKIPYFKFNVSQTFNNKIFNYFIKSYKNGTTPNPCLLCNKEIKWHFLDLLANKLNCPHIATGHYANIRHTNKSVYLYESIDPNKDQTFFLWDVPKTILNKALFPLGKKTKEEVRNIAKSNNLNFLNKKKESFDICFAPKTGYTTLLKQNRKKDSGKIINESGVIIGKHLGIHKYTIGQKIKYLSVSGTPYYVKKINPKNNELIVTEKENLYTNKITLSYTHFFNKNELTNNTNLDIKTYYRGNYSNCQIDKIQQNKFIVTLSKPTYAPAKGQTVIFKKGELIVGGGIID